MIFKSKFSGTHSCLDTYATCNGNNVPSGLSVVRKNMHSSNCIPTFTLLKLSVNQSKGGRFLYISRTSCEQGVSLMFVRT
jgi:hypothetical protein